MKSSKFRFFRLVALVIVMAQLLSLSTVVAFASSNDETIQQNETILPVESTITENLISTENVVLEPERELKPVISSDKFTTSEKIQLGFDKTDVIDYYYVANGVTVTEVTDNSMEFEIDAVDEFGSVDVYADYGNGELVKSSIYTYKQGDVVYISDISKDRAWYNCMEEQYNQGLLTKEEWNDRYSELSQTFIKEDLSNNNTSVSLMATSTTTTVKGRLQWELADGTLLPLRQTKVELRDKEPIDSRSIATTYTDNNGNFTFTFENPDEWYNFENGGLDVFIRWYTETKTFEVKQDLVFTYNYFETPVKENVTTGSTTTFNYYVTYDTSNNVNKSIYVLQGMVVGQRFATAMGMSTDNFIHVIYPSGDGSIFPSDSAFCWGEILDNCYSIIGTNKFNDFDTLIHEYGHFVECSMGNYGSTLWEILVNNPTHSANDDHFNEKPEKEYAMELTWSEAWATAFAQLAQNYYSKEYNGVPGFADVTVGTVNYEDFEHNEYSGEAQEHAVIAFLWDLYDGGTNETYDNIALGYQNIPDAFLDCFGIHLKYNLVNSVYASYPYQHNCAKKDDPLSMCHYCNKPASHVESLVQDCQAGNHHKECNKIRLSTPEQPKKIFGSLLFCGHKTCAISNGTHVDFDGNIGGGWGSNADVFPIKFSDPKDYNCIKRVVYHELLHMFTVTHHYNASSVQDCVHGNNRFDNNVERQLSTCPECKAKVNGIKIAELFNY